MLPHHLFSCDATQPTHVLQTTVNSRVSLEDKQSNDDTGLNYLRCFSVFMCIIDAETDLLKTQGLYQEETKTKIVE